MVDFSRLIWLTLRGTSVIIILENGRIHSIAWYPVCIVHPVQVIQTIYIRLLLPLLRSSQKEVHFLLTFDFPGRFPDIMDFFNKMCFLIKTGHISP